MVLIGRNTAWLVFMQRLKALEQEESQAFQELYGNNSNNNNNKKRKLAV